MPLTRLYPAVDGFLLVLQSFLLLVQFLKLEAYEVFAGGRSWTAASAAAGGAAAVVSVPGRHHLTLLLLLLLLLLRRLLLVMMMLLFGRQVPVMYLRLLRLRRLLGMIHRRVTESHRRVRRLTNVSRCRQSQTATVNITLRHCYPVIMTPALRAGDTKR